MIKLSAWAKQNGIGYKRALIMAKEGDVPNVTKVGNRWMVKDQYDLAEEARVNIAPSPRSVIADILTTVGVQAEKYRFLAERRVSDPDYKDKLPFSGRDMMSLESMISSLKKINIETERLDRQDMLNGLPDNELKRMLVNFLNDNPSLLPNLVDKGDRNDMNHAVKQLSLKETKDE